MALSSMSHKWVIVGIVAIWLACGIASPGIVIADEVSEVGRHWLVRAKAEQLLAVTTAEASRAKAQQLERLHDQGFAGWTETAAARSDAAREAAKIAANQRFTNWLMGEIAAVADDSKTTTPSLVARVTRLELSLPGSRAVLGWVQPDRLSGDKRSSILELLRRRSELLATDDIEIVMARRRVSLLQDRVRRLARPSAAADSVERQAADGQLRIATARLAVAEAASLQLRADHATLVSAINAVPTSHRNSSVTSSEARPETAVAVRQRALQVLAFETQTIGEIETARAAKQLARMHVAGCDALRNQQQISQREWQRAQNDLGRSVFGWEQLTALKDWQGRWEQALDRDKATVAARSTAGSSRDAVTLVSNVKATDTDQPSEALTTAQRCNASRFRKVVVLMRQWCEAEAEVEAMRAERNWRGDVVARLQAQRTPNDREIEVASAGVALSDGRLRLATERVQLLRLLWQQEAAAGATDNDVACELSLIGDIEAGAILDAATRRVDRENATSWTERIVACERRVAGLQQLRELGHASAEELASVELSLAEMRDEQTASGRRRQLAELERELTGRLLSLGQF